MVKQPGRLSSLASPLPRLKLKMDTQRINVKSGALLLDQQAGQNIESVVSDQTILDLSSYLMFSLISLGQGQ